MPFTQPMVTVQEAAEILHVHPQTIRRAIKRGELPVYNAYSGTRTKYLITEEALREYVKSHQPSEE